MVKFLLFQLGLPNTVEILDVACGTGVVAQECKQVGYHQVYCVLACTINVLNVHYKTCVLSSILYSVVFYVYCICTAVLELLPRKGSKWVITRWNILPSTMHTRTGVLNCFLVLLFCTLLCYKCTACALWNITLYNVVFQIDNHYFKYFAFMNVYFLISR